MLEDTYERHVIGGIYADERVGLYVIRGENLVLLGELVSLLPWPLPLHSALTLRAPILLCFFPADVNAAQNQQDQERDKENGKLREVTLAEIQVRCLRGWSCLDSTYMG